MLSRRTVLLQSGGFGIVAAMGLPGIRAFAETVPGTPRMIVHRGTPLNAEPRGALLRSSFLTGQDNFYIRNHGTIPTLLVETYRLQLQGDGVTPTTLTLSDIQTRFPQRSIKAVLQCAGNRRADFTKVKSVSGDGWQAGAISNAEWTGVGLGDVLKAAGVAPKPGMHVAFASHDEIEEEGEHFNYGVSIPLEKALASETLLAFAMNGEPLSAEHGFPLRVVTPGYAGVRSPKWLASITVQDHPSDNHIQQKEYKLLPPEMTKETQDLSKGVTINEMPLNSAILEPAEGARLARGKNVVRGYAIATGVPIRRVEVSADGGKNWREAKLESHPDAPWSWTFWSADVDLHSGPAQLVARAYDNSGATQPASAAEIYNFPGYLCRAWHRVNVQVA